MRIEENVSLKDKTSFHIGGNARYFCSVQNINDALQALEFSKEHSLEILLLSGGSNMLVSDNGWDGLVVQVDMFGMEKVLDTMTECVLKVATGEVWDEVVSFAVKEGLWGIENLSHIPGRTGAIAVQNVGAYGQEAKDVIVSVDALDTQTKELVTLSGNDCKFSYRSSIFNTTQKGRYIIFYTRFKLSKIPRPVLTYKDLALIFPEGQGVLEDIRKAVIQIRDRKFPFPNTPKKGNAGSCFKNVYLSSSEFGQFKERIKVGFESQILDRLNEIEKRFTEEDRVKIPAAFLLDICGLKGLTFKGALINPLQPLVIVNASGDASSFDVLEIMKIVKHTVYSKTGIALNIEPELVGFTKEELDRYLLL